MEIGSSTSLSTLPSLGETGATQPVPPPAPADAAIERPAKQAVAVAPAAPPHDARGDLVKQEAPTDIVRRQITVDQETHKVVYQAVDTRTGDVVYQLPDIRYLKAYAEQIKASEGDGSRSSIERLA